MAIVPASVPQPEIERVLRFLATLGDKESLILLAIRGYYRRSMGNPNCNDRAVYDDACILLHRGTIATWNFNTDPSLYRPATADRKGIAVLEPGKWLYKIGTHGLSRPREQQYTALVQAAPVTIRRDGGKIETGWFGINIHRGGNAGTSSEGCQTVPSGRQWDQFIGTIGRIIGRGTIPYRLVHVDTWESL